MSEAPFIRSLRIENLLSYGADSPAIELRPLNVLIGPNGSGKSNLIEVLGLLAAAPGDLLEPIRARGGLEDWLNKSSSKPVEATVEATIDYPAGRDPLRYALSFTQEAGRFRLLREVLADAAAVGRPSEFHYLYSHDVGQVTLNRMVKGERVRRDLKPSDIDLESSVLSQRRDPDLYPELTWVATQFSRMSFYREWNLGRFAPCRLPQRTDFPAHVLAEDAHNLALVLSDIQNIPAVDKRIQAEMRTFFEQLDRVTTRVHGGTIQIFLHERGLARPVPATTMSDGTLRYLSLLAILLHPTPPALVCIEEPELGLHPDILPTLADLLLDASTRTQLIVTTHSDILVDALSAVPESVMVCEREEHGTVLRRLDATSLQPWLEKYRLGDLWTRGEIGGTRW